MAEDEYKELFIAEAIDMIEGLNNALTELESNPSDSYKIDEIFRIMHTLKGNALGMGFHEIGDLAHVIEDLFGEIKKNNGQLPKELIEYLFRALDKVNEMIDALASGEKVSYKGLRTKLQVYHGKIKAEHAPAVTVQPAAPADEMASSIANVAPQAEENQSVDTANEAASAEVTEKEGAISIPEAETEVLAEVAENAIPTAEVGEEKVLSIKEIAESFAKEQGLRVKDEHLIVAENEATKAASVPVAAIKAELETEESHEAEAQAELPVASDDDAQQKSRISFSESIQVPTRKVDDLMNLIGELLIERDTVSANLANENNSFNNFDRLNRIVSDLQYGIMNIRLVKVGFLFNKFTRIVRDVANIEGKDVELYVEGAEIEIDRNVLKTISDAMIHLVRNAVSHGIENSDGRKLYGKPIKGRVTLNARNENDSVVIQVADDGYGMDPEKILKKAISKGLVDKETAKVLTRDEILMYIFEPGFSNAEVVNEVSGRGVGMDVVKRAVESIGGRVQLDTIVGKGSTISLHLPSSLAVKGALLFELEKQEYAITINYTEAVLSLTAKDLHRLPKGCLTEYLGNPISVVFLSELYEGIGNTQIQKSTDQDKKLDVIVVRYQNRLFGIVVDKLLLQQEIVEKHLKGMLGANPLFKSATILGNGNVCLILDVPSIFRLVQDKSKHLRKVA